MGPKVALQTLTREVSAAHQTGDTKAIRKIVLSHSFLSAMADPAIQMSLDRPLGSYLHRPSSSLFPFQEEGAITSVRDVVVNGRESLMGSPHRAILLAAASGWDLPVFERGSPYYAASIANNLGRVNLRAFYEEDIPLLRRFTSIDGQPRIVTTVSDVLTGAAKLWIEPQAFTTIAEAIAPVVETFATVQMAVGRLICKKYRPRQ